jgi:ABC-type transport system substrate-binding protein
VIVRNIPDAAARLMALEAGEIDMIFGSDWISYDDYERAVAMENIAGKTSESDVRTRVIVLNAANEALGDAKVRKAIACAVDKQGIVEGFMHGYEAVADQPLSASLPYCDVQIRTVQAYDMEQAAALLKEAGWSDTDGDGILDQDGAALSLTFKYPQERALNAEMARSSKRRLANWAFRWKQSPWSTCSGRRRPSPGILTSASTPPTGIRMTRRTWSTPFSPAWTARIRPSSRSRMDRR